MHRKTIMKAGTVLLLPVAITACGNRITDNGAPIGGTPTPAPTPAPTPTPVANIQTRIGANFLAFFNASQTAEPRKPVQSDLPPLSLTTEPLQKP